MQMQSATDKVSEAECSLSNVGSSGPSVLSENGIGTSISTRCEIIDPVRSSSSDDPDENWALVDDFSIAKGKIIIVLTVD